MLYQGHGSFRLTSNDRLIIYVDPYAGEGYDLPADIILVTHQHYGHNKVKLCARKLDCRVITNKEALAGGNHKSFDVCGVLNSGKASEEYIVKFDNLIVDKACTKIYTI